MAKDLAAIIRLHKYIVDEKRRDLGVLLGEVRELEHRAERLKVELVSEQQAAHASPEEAGFLYGPYAAAAINRRQQLNDATVEFEEKIAIAQEEMREEFKELKVFEIAKEARDEAEEEERSSEEQRVLDELGQESHRRRNKSKNDKTEN
jgi:flagellar FliJ protein